LREVERYKKMCEKRKEKKSDKEEERWGRRAHKGKSVWQILCENGKKERR
jgi:hypothetical protein